MLHNKLLGSAHTDDLNSPERQRRPGHLDEPQRQIPSEYLVTYTKMGKDHWNQLSPYNLTLLQLEQTTGSSGQMGTGPPTEPGFSQGFFLRSVTNGVLVPFCCRLWLA